MKDANIYRFHGFAALSLPGNGETVYLLPEDARNIAKALNACARDIASHGFIESGFTSKTVPLKNGGSRFNRD